VYPKYHTKHTLKYIGNSNLTGYPVLLSAKSKPKVFFPALLKYDCPIKIVYA
jgi:hypothetical protein